jgi:hypothetical protein
MNDCYMTLRMLSSDLWFVTYHSNHFRIITNKCACPETNDCRTSASLTTKPPNLLECYSKLSFFLSEAIRFLCNVCGLSVHNLFLAHVFMYIYSVSSIPLRQLQMSIISPTPQWHGLTPQTYKKPTPTQMIRKNNINEKTYLSAV